MKILHIIFALDSGGGAEEMLVDITNEQVKTGNKIGILVINDIVNDELVSKLDNKISIFRVNRKETSKNPIDILKLNYFISKFRPDVIHSHNSSIIKLIFYPLAKNVLTVHDINVDSKYFSRYDKLFAISEAVKEDIIKKGDYNVYVVINGIKIEDIKSKNIQSKVLQNILQVSRMYSDKKGQDILLKAVAILIHNYKLDLKLDFIGEGPSLQEMKELALNLRIEDRVNFLGFRYRDYVYNNLCEYDLYVQASRFEGFGLTVAEAMAAKVPVLVSDIDGPMEIIDNGKYGNFFKVGDVEDCANQILHIYNNYSDVCQKVDDAYKRVEDNYSIIKTASAYIEEYLIM